MLPSELWEDLDIEFNEQPADQLHPAAKELGLTIHSSGSCFLFLQDPTTVLDNGEGDLSLMRKKESLWDLQDTRGSLSLLISLICSCGVKFCKCQIVTRTSRTPRTWHLRLAMRLVCVSLRVVPKPHLLVMAHGLMMDNPQ